MIKTNLVNSFVVYISPSFLYGFRMRVYFCLRLYFDHHWK